MYPPVHAAPKRAWNKRGHCIVLMDRHVMEVVCRRMVMVVCDLRPRRKPRRARARVLETWRGPERDAYPDPLERAARPGPALAPDLTRIHKEELSVGLRVTCKICLWATNAMRQC